MSQRDNGQHTRRLVSVVVPALNEADNVPGLLKRFAQFSVDHPDYDFELVLVDDGSDDGTGDLVLAGSSASDRVKVVSLSRSFGSHYAISAGLARCSGDSAVVFGADLQEPASLLHDFLSHWEAGSEVVWGVRRTRTGRSASQELTSKAFSAIFTRFANLASYPPEGPSGVLIDRCVIDALSGLPERNRNVLALIAWLGFKQSRVDYDQIARKHGQSRWTKRKMIKLAVDSLIQFSAMPLRACSFAGAMIALVGIAYAVFLVVRSLFGVETPAGWPTVLVSILVLGGAQLSLIGIMGEYLWRAVEETRSRPLYVIRNVRTAGTEPEEHSVPAARAPIPETPMVIR